MLTLFGKLHGTCAGRSGVWCLLIFLSFLATVILAQDFRESRKLRLATERLLKNEISKFSDDERRSARYGHILQQIRRPLRYEEQTPGNCDNSVDCDSNDRAPVRPKITYHDAYRLRAVQCTEFDKKTYNGKHINWKPYMRDHLNLCKLYCLASGHKFYAQLKNTVRDGTPCGKDYSKICIQGRCQKRPAGCKTLDGPCKVEKRRKVIGVFNSTKLQIGYNLVATIPAGATDINVEELTKSRSYLALKDHSSETYYLNGHWMISLSKTFQSAGTKLHYKRNGNTRRGGETIKAEGPLEKSLDIMMIYQRDPSTIVYSFFVTKKEYEKLKQKSGTGGQNPYFSDISKTSEQSQVRTTIPGRKTENRRLPFSPNNKHGVDYSTKQQQGDSISFFGQKPAPRRNSGRQGFSYPQRPQPPVGQQRFVQGGKANNGQSGDQQSGSWYGSSWVQFGGDQSNTKQGSDGSTQFSRSQVLNQKVFKPNQFGRGGPGPRNSYGQTSQRLDNSKIRSHQRPGWVNTQRQGSRVPQYQGRQWQNSGRTAGQFYTSDQEDANGRSLQTYIWRTAGFTPCSASCAGGIQSGTVTCIRSNTGETVLIAQCDPKLRPPERRRVCNLQPCPARWAPQEWKDCSKSCGEGVQMRDLMCKQVIDRSGEKVTAMLPIVRCPIHLRPEIVRKCFLKPCPEIPKPKWVMGSWGKCSVECGHGVQKRIAFCKDYENETIDASDCNPTQKPSILKACYLGLCQAAWYSRTYWSQCSKTCGTGIRSRPVVCARVDGGALDQRHCKDKKKPDDSQTCNERHCQGIWMTSEWSKCSTDCGTGLQERVVICMKHISGSFQETHDRHCSIDDKPAVRKACGNNNCMPTWFSTPWTECSVTCGHGVETRRVSCLDGEGAKVGGCKAWERPQQRRACYPKQCPGTERKKPAKVCTDKPPPTNRNYCYVIKRINYCRFEYFKKRCCETCSSER